MLRRGLDLRVLSEPPSRPVLAAGAASSLALGMAGFAMWGFGSGGFADDRYLWWTLAGFVLPLLGAAGVVLLGRTKPETAPAIAVAVIMLGAAFVGALLT